MGIAVENDYQILNKKPLPDSCELRELHRKTRFVQKAMELVPEASQARRVVELQHVDPAENLEKLCQIF